MNFTNELIKKETEFIDEMRKRSDECLSLASDAESTVVAERIKLMILDILRKSTTQRSIKDIRIEAHENDEYAVKFNFNLSDFYMKFVLENLAKEDIVVEIQRGFYMLKN